MYKTELTSIRWKIILEFADLMLIDHYLNYHFILLWEKLWKGRLYCCFLKEYFLSQAQFKKFLWFQGYSSACIFVLPEPPVLSSHIYIVKDISWKYLHAYLLHIFFFHAYLSPLLKCLGMTLILSTNHRWSQKYDSFLVKTDMQKMPQVTVLNANPIN